jgi:hypothetical protein
MKTKLIALPMIIGRAGGDQCAERVRNLNHQWLQHRADHLGQRGYQRNFIGPEGVGEQRQPVGDRRGP